MTTEYIEINSAYRDRNRYPLASDFVVHIADFGSRSPIQAADPYSDAAPLIPPFIPFFKIAGTIASPTTAPSFLNSSEQMTIVIVIPSGSASKITNYYAGAVLFNAAGTSSLARILQWDYINTVGGNDRFQFSSDQPISPGTSVTINDPSDFGDPANILVFLPSSIGSANTDNYYAGDFIFNQTRNEWLVINAYDGISHSAFMFGIGSSHYTSGTWTSTDTYILRAEIPMQYNQTLNILTATTATIVPPTINSFVGNFIRIVSTGQIVQIIRFDGSPSNIVTVYPQFSIAAPAAVAYEMLQFSGDNEGRLLFNNTSSAIREAVCYDVSLLSLIIPSATLETSKGSRAIFYPYFYIELRSLKNADGQGTNTMITNNPNAKRALFRSTIFDSPDSLLNPFIRLAGDGIVHRIKLDPLGSYRFRLFLPDGSYFKTVLDENFSPQRPNPIAQISALFSITRVMV